MNIDERKIHAVIKRLQTLYPVERVNDVSRVVAGKSVADQLMDSI
jgi:hypothetical protein